MAKIQLCRNGCGGYIVVQEDPQSGKWKPWDCDDVGNPIDLHNCPNNPYYSSQGGGGATKTVKRTPYVQSTSTTTSTTAGGSTLDTKRILQTLVELTKEIRELKDIVQSRTIIDTNKYEGLNNQLYNALAKYINEGSFGTATKLLEPKDRQAIINDNAPLIKHSDKVDEYERTKQFVQDDHKNEEDENNTGGVED